MTSRPGIHTGMSFSRGTPGTFDGMNKMLDTVEDRGDADHDAAHSYKFVLALPAAGLAQRASRKNPAAGSERHFAQHKGPVKPIVGAGRVPGRSIIATKRNIMIPNSKPDQRT